MTIIENVEEYYIQKLQKYKIMGYFDFLIDQGNGKPKPGMEYIYRLNMCWRPGQLGYIPMKIGTIMIDVVQLENKSYEFTNKETGERLRTNYAWSLAENTPDNIKKIEEYDKEYTKFKEHEKQVNNLFKKIKTV